MKQVYVIATAVLSCFFVAADCKATIFLRLLSFSNKDGTLSNGKKCDASSRTKLCDYLFEARMGDNNKFGTYISRNAMNDHPNTEITLEKFNQYIPQPITFNIQDEAVPPHVTVSVKVLDDSQTTPELVFMATTRISIKPTLYGRKDWLKTTRTEGKKKLDFEIAIECKLNYYGDTCMTFCEPQDSDADGHYNCSESGQKVCLAGYTGSDCTTIDTCASADVCNSRGTCTVSGNSFVCECSESYEGDHCETEKSACSGHTCENGASCSVQDNVARCQCTEPWAGERCELAREAECSVEEARQCSNGATCMKTYNDSLGFYNAPVCNCTPGYLAPDCSTPHPCLLNHTCNSRGRCIVVGDHFSCQCEAGYSGPRCEQTLDPCSPNPCSNNATCRPDGSLATCLCLPHYSGRMCSTYTDPCLRLSCLNGGVCSVTGDAFGCSCPAEFGGQQCETWRNPCLNNASLCLNGATCSGNARDATYNCLCASHFSGPRCETYNDPCARNPCNNGICSATRDGFKCTCGVQFTGSDCSVPRDPCEYTNATCLNGGTCSGDATQRTAQCFCAPNFSGTRCETYTDPCQPNPCRNGRCSVTLNGHECLCDAEYEGADCSTPRNPCIRLSTPCLNNGTCVGNATTKSHYCICKPPYSGTRCATYTDPCIRNPCKNGRCNANRDGFQCICSVEFTGADCSEPRDPCEYTNATCLNGGTCSGDVSQGSTVCFCAPNFSGMRCETYTDPCRPNPCRNGRCSVTLNGHECLCDAEYEGADCSTPRNPCIRLSTPCLNNGTCVGNATTKSHYCICKPHYSGTRCATYTDPCIRNPCKNGRCSATRESYECLCPEEYEGQDCSVPRNPCVRNATLCNTGRCVGNHIQGTYSCTCPANYRGRHCEEFVPSSRFANKVTSAGVALPKVFPTSKIALTIFKAGASTSTKASANYRKDQSQESKSNESAETSTRVSDSNGDLPQAPAGHDALADELNMHAPDSKLRISSTMRYLLLGLIAAVVLLLATAVAVCIKILQRKVPRTRRPTRRAAAARIIDFSSTYSYSVPKSAKEEDRQLSVNADGPSDQRYASLLRPRTASFALSTSTLGRSQNDASLAGRLVSVRESSFTQERDSLDDANYVTMVSTRAATLNRVQPIIEQEEYGNVSQFATLRKFSLTQVPPAAEEADDLYANVATNNERSSGLYLQCNAYPAANDFPLPPETIAEVNDCDSFSNFSGIDEDDQVYENH